MAQHWVPARWCNGHLLLTALQGPAGYSAPRLKGAREAERDRPWPENCHSRQLLVSQLSCMASGTDLCRV